MNRELFWIRVNSFGYALERSLQAAVVLAAVMFLLLTMMRWEWGMLPVGAQAEVLCSEELAYSAYAEFGASGQTLETLKDLPRECRSVTSLGQQADKEESLADDWLLPLAFPFPLEGEP